MFRQGLMCRHPNLCSRYDVIFDERVGGAFVVSAHVEHGTLLTLDHAGVSARSRDICTARCLWYCRQLLDALVYLHDRGVVHGFISCNDVLLGQDDTVLLKRHGMVSDTINSLLSELLEIAVGLKMNSTQHDLSPTRYQALREQLLKEVLTLRAVPKRSSHHDNMSTSVITALEHIDAIYDYCFQAPEGLREILEGMRNGNNNLSSSAFGVSDNERRSPELSNNNEQQQAEQNSNNNNNNNNGTSSNLKTKISEFMQRDIYSLGMVFYVMTFGCLPFRISLPSSFTSFQESNNNNRRASVFGYQGQENSAGSHSNFGSAGSFPSGSEFNNTMKPNSSTANVLHQSLSGSTASSITTANLHYAAYYAQSKPQFPIKPSPNSIKKYIDQVLECCEEDEEENQEPQQNENGDDPNLQSQHHFDPNINNSDATMLFNDGQNASSASFLTASPSSALTLHPSQPSFLRPSTSTSSLAAPPTPTKRPAQPATGFLSQTTSGIYHQQSNNTFTNNNNIMMNRGVPASSQSASVKTKPNRSSDYDHVRPYTCLIPPFDKLRAEEILESPSNDLGYPEGSFCRPMEEIPRDFLKLLSRMLSPRPEDRCTAQTALDTLDLILASQEYRKLCDDASDEFRVLFPNRKKFELKREVINRHELPLMALASSSSSSASNKNKRLDSKQNRIAATMSLASISATSIHHRSLINSIPSSRIIEKLLSRRHNWFLEDRLWSNADASDDKNDAIAQSRFYNDDDNTNTTASDENEGEGGGVFSSMNAEDDDDEFFNNNNISNAFSINNSQSTYQPHQVGRFSGGGGGRNSSANHHHHHNRFGTAGGAGAGGVGSPLSSEYSAPTFGREGTGVYDRDSEYTGTALPSRNTSMFVPSRNTSMISTRRNISGLAPRRNTSVMIRDPPVSDEGVEDVVALVVDHVEEDKPLHQTTVLLPPPQLQVLLPHLLQKEQVTLSRVGDSPSNSLPPPHHHHQDDHQDQSASTSGVATRNTTMLVRREYPTTISAAETNSSSGNPRNDNKDQNNNSDTKEEEEEKDDEDDEDVAPLGLTRKQTRKF